MSSVDPGIFVSSIHLSNTTFQDPLLPSFFRIISKAPFTQFEFLPHQATREKNRSSVLIICLLMSLLFKSQKVNYKNIEIKWMLTTILKMGCRWVAFYLLRIHRHLYVYTSLSNNEYEENLFICRIKRVLGRLQNVGCKRLDIYSQTHIPFLVFL